MPGEEFDISALTLQDITAMKFISDPVLWAESTLRDFEDHTKPFKARWYQAKMLRSKSKRRVTRAGRRIGKTVAMCIHILWYAFTHADRSQLVVCPYQSQVNAIFDTLRILISSSPQVEDSIGSITKSPYYVITLKNGHKVSGFTTGTRTGAQGGALRGQGGDWIYFDEQDYMTDKDFESVYAIATSNSRVGVWMSSTPTGRRGIFYRACIEQKNIWEEHYYPSMVNPEWNDAMEDEMRTIYTDQGYTHEVLAEFGEETIGVFAKEHIDRAQQKYAYITAPSYKAIRFIGVDWDKYGSATQIAVVEFDDTVTNHKKELGMFRVINRVEIPKGQFTLDNAVQKIEEFNDIYQPAGIYIDRGYGEYQVETLHLHGLQNPETNLHKRVVGIHFGGFKEVMDPATRKMENKPMKVFLVSQLQLLFERDKMIISDEDEMIIKQLENYRMVKKRPGGMPVFTDEDEHTIDCLMLAVLGFIDQFPHLAKYIKPQGATGIATVKVNSAIDQGLMPKDPFGRDEGWDEPGPAPLVKVQIGSKGENYGRTKSWGDRSNALKSPIRRGFR